MCTQTAEAYDHGEDHTDMHTRELCIQTLFLPEVGQLTYVLLEEPLAGGEYTYAITVRCVGERVFSACRTVHDITTNRDLALRLFWQVCRGTVTPWGLLELLPELLP